MTWLAVVEVLEGMTNNFLIKYAESKEKGKKGEQSIGESGNFRDQIRNKSFSWRVGGGISDKADEKWRCFRWPARNGSIALQERIQRPMNPGQGDLDGGGGSNPGGLLLTSPNAHDSWAQFRRISLKKKKQGLIEKVFRHFGFG
ncbi:hypothetical protein AVEN_235568-1 [Araneus ventricosus]|uniref:Uncharacterized protein n=1 Tax=Araneus ventricosus TaxID=182803 RepID=A0A4Y2BR78_ARAVE|nr:hypothetical protein AVEN_235568-1 [Araneus ventricosus]